MIKTMIQVTEWVVIFGALISLLVNRDMLKNFIPTDSLVAEGVKASSSTLFATILLNCFWVVVLGCL